MAAPRGLAHPLTMTAIARWIGLIVGLSLALVALAQARIPAGTGQVPAYASLQAEPSVKLAVTPVGRELLASKAIMPGHSVSGLVEISNLTGHALAVRPRLRRLGEDTPDALRLQLTTGSRTLYDGALGDFHARTLLRPRAAQPLRFRFSIPPAAHHVQGRSAKLILHFDTERAGR